MDAGHTGVSGRFASLGETALEFAFALTAVGAAGQDISLSR
jgi:protease II